MKHYEKYFKRCSKNGANLLKNRYMQKINKKNIKILNLSEFLNVDSTQQMLWLWLKVWT